MGTLLSALWWCIPLTLRTGGVTWPGQDQHVGCVGHQVLDFTSTPAGSELGKVVEVGVVTQPARQTAPSEIR